MSKCFNFNDASHRAINFVKKMYINSLHYTTAEEIGHKVFFVAKNAKIDFFPVHAGLIGTDVLKAFSSVKKLS